MMTANTIPLTAVPGPKPLPLIGNLRYLRPDTHRALVRAREEYGDLVHFQVNNRHLYFAAHPEDVKYILVDNNRNYHKGRGIQKAKPLLGEGLLTSEDDFWRRQRRLAQPAFHRQQIASLADTMTTSTAVLIDRWQPLARSGATLNVAEEMMGLTLDIVTKALFSTALTPEEIHEVGASMAPLLRHTIQRTQAVFDFIEKLPLPSNRRSKQLGMRLDQIVYRIIEARRQSGVEHADLLGMLMAARDEETGESMTDVHLRDEVMTLFLAGHETTALLLSWTWALLSWHPDVRRRAQEEVDQVLGDRTPTAEDVTRLPYLGMILSESLRLYPPAWAIPRRPLAEDEIRGYRIPAGCTVLVSPYVTHRHPDFWENPEGFDPERFTSKAVKDRHRFAYFPFGGGPRICIGNNFALMEATLVVAMILQRYEINLIPGHAVEAEVAFTLRPKNGVPVSLKAR
ncbi:MAG: cytochrome P450 [Caldilineaceae bacterium]|nr:cytochrome P450 [Caldilineaceae bacterium]